MKLKWSILTIGLLVSFNLFGQELKVGDKAPDITMNLLNGEEFKLSQLQGQMVLIDFWAAWCKPCRNENPHIVEVYKKYKDSSFKNGEGFTVLSVSLDFKKLLWERAIQDDKLEWPYHVSDLKGWKNSAAVAYGVKSIPAGYLIDGEGTIIAVNLRAYNLDRKLKRQLKKNFFFNWFN